jgi:nucleoside-diphosphate-sugar epimerase
VRTLITGAPGWLGNRLLEILVAGFDKGDSPVNDWDIRCLVMPNVDYRSIRELTRFKKIDCIEGDITRSETLSSAFENVDLVIHIAGIIHPKSIRELYDVNTLGTMNVLRESVRHGVKRLIYISSNSVAGTNLSRDILMKEEDAPRPYMHYGISKYEAEQLVQEQYEKKQLQTVILRPCWYYGPNQPERQTTFFKMIKKGSPIIFGNGNNLRSMSYVDNTCEAILLAAASEKANGQIYWIADEKAYTANEIYQTIAELLKVKNFKPTYVPGGVSEICLLADKVLQGAGLYIKEIHVAGEMNKNIACSIEKAKKELGYRPKISLREGMQRSILWCQQNGVPI